MFSVIRLLRVTLFAVGALAAAACAVAADYPSRPIRLIVPFAAGGGNDTAKDFAPVSLVASAPLILVVHPSVPANSVQELIALARAKPGTLNYGSNGNGSSSHLAAAMFESMAHIDIRWASRPRNLRCIFGRRKTAWASS